jgi:hypothetical protein
LETPPLLPHGALTNGTSEGRSLKPDRVSYAVRRLLQDVLSHLRFDGFRFGTIRQSCPSFIKHLSEENQGFGIIMGHRSTSRSPIQRLIPPAVG